LGEKVADKLVVYTAQSKKFFYCRDAVCEFVFSCNGIPVNPFRVFDYFLSDRVDRNKVREANAEVLARCDEVWVFGEALADGVLLEIAQAVTEGKPLRYFSIDNHADRIHELKPECLHFENEVHNDTGLTQAELLKKILNGEATALAEALRRPIRVTA
jgi:hypothetical protein